MGVQEVMGLLSVVVRRFDNSVMASSRIALGIPFGMLKVVVPFA